MRNSLRVLSALLCASFMPDRSASSQDAGPSDLGALAVTYSPSDENFPNPERGFYRQFNAFDTGTVRRPLDARTLAAFRVEGITLVRVYYVIDEFRNAPLSRAALDAIDADFVAVRQAGLRIIPRFAYSFPCAGSPPPCTVARIAAEAIDPPVGRVLEHIDQLTASLRAGSDIIAFMEMGFVGAWGEWHHSSTGLVSTDHTVNTNSSAIVDRVLFALSDRRAAVLRYPYHKQALFGPLPLDISEAFTRTPRARLGAHNDCFLSNADDSGTYSPPSRGPANKNVQALKKFLSFDNRFVPQGGETCSTAAAAQPYIGCASALGDLALTQWSTINIAYQPDVIRLWQQQGCFPDVQRRLGYRFRLLGLDAPAQVRRGAVLALRLTLTNDGWAAPYNPRAAEVILRHVVSGRLHVIPMSEDPRLWGPGVTRTLDVRDVLPGSLEPGSYQVLLNLPDPEDSLRGRAEYSIRMANIGAWESATGYNDLQARVQVN
jgi:hypothetical protein